LKDEKNAKRINKILSKLKLKNKDERKSPNTSATFYNNGDIKIGNDRFFWIIKNNKWYLLDNDIQEYSFSFNNNDKILSSLLKLSCISEHSKKPIFIKNVTYNRNKYTVNILYNNDTKKLTSIFR
jgi:hypothetical protein